MILNSLLHQWQVAAYFDNHDKVLIAVSGGVDSMNLLHFLHQHQNALAIQIAVAHVNHGQRPESDVEETYIKHWAKEQDIPCFVSRFEGIFTEEGARQWRYAFFQRVMVEQGYTALVTGHHREDQVETILMRLIRGSRLRHLSGIKAVQSFGPGQLIRPFLALSKKDLPECYHFEDSSNWSLQFFRNRVRHQLLPQLEQENPQISQALLSLANEVSLLQSALRELTQGLTVTDAPRFLKQSPAVQDYLLQEYLEQFPDLSLSRAQYDNLLHIIRTKPTYYHPLKAGYFLKKTPESICVTRIGPKTDSQESEKQLECEQTTIYGNYQITWSSDRETDGIPIFSDSPILLRSRKTGDRLDLGRFQKKLSRLLIDDKVPLDKRQRLIVGEQDGEIIFMWTEGKTYLRKVSENAIMKGKLYIQKQDEGEKHA